MIVASGVRSLMGAYSGVSVDASTVQVYVPDPTSITSVEPGRMTRPYEFAGTVTSTTIEAPSRRHPDDASSYEGAEEITRSSVPLR